MITENPYYVLHVPFTHQKSPTPASQARTWVESMSSVVNIEGEERRSTVVEVWKDT